jgi:hypothetical protein
MGRPRKEVNINNRQKNLLTIRGTEAWKRWLDGFAEKRRMPVTVLIDQALAEAAKAAGYPEPPPRY